MKKETCTYTLIDYTDVWGNEEDGWQVNDQTPLYRDLNITDDASDQDILTYLKNTGYLITDSPDFVTIDDMGDGVLEIFETENGFPIGRLQKNP